MEISQAKRDANRRNAQKSTGPKTQGGKERSRRNALRHGLRAETLVLLDEDAEELEARKEGWRAAFSPRDDYEQQTIDEAVEYSWIQDRARRAQAARLAANRTNAGLAEAKREADEALRLGAKLFADNAGHLADYPHEGLSRLYMNPRVSVSELTDDPQDPPRLILHLESTAGGCQWLLDRWADLKQILDDGLLWQSADKLKAVRLLGRQPLEAVDDRNALLMYLACQVLEGLPPGAIREIFTELKDDEVSRYQKRLKGRGIDRLAPTSKEAALQALYGTIERETVRIKSKAEEHRRRNETLAALAADRLLFDDSREGELLRRYELANGRSKVRAINELQAHRRSSGPLPVVRDPLLETAGPVENATEEANTGQIPDAICPAQETALAGEIATSEATTAHENSTNEPTAGDQVFAVSRFLVGDCGLEAAIAASTNEATDGPLPSVSCPWSEDGESLGNELPGASPGIDVALSENVFPTENFTNQSSSFRPVQSGALWAKDEDEDFDFDDDEPDPDWPDPTPEEQAAEDAEMDAEIARMDREHEEAVARNREVLAAALADIRQKREEFVRKLNEDARGEGQAARLARKVLHEVSIKAARPAKARTGKSRAARKVPPKTIPAMVQVSEDSPAHLERRVAASVECPDG